jgi:hypothetical protein
VYALPLVGYFPIVIKALRRLKEINSEFYYQSRWKIYLLIFLLEVFLIWRVFWYFTMIFDEILTNGQFNSNIVFLYCSEVVFLSMSIMILIKNLQNDQDDVNASLLKKTYSGSVLGQSFLDQTLYKSQKDLFVTQQNV